MQGVVAGWHLGVVARIREALVASWREVWRVG